MTTRPGTAKRPTKPKMTFEVIDVTPDLAKEWIGIANYQNRKLRNGRVESYADMMRRGQWVMTGDPIRFDVNGRLIDGQHRLHALALADVTLPMLVISDAPEDAFHVIDSGLMRSYADSLQGVSSGANKAAAIRLIYAYELEADVRLRNSLMLVNRVDVVDFYNAHTSEIEFAWTEGDRVYRRHTAGNGTAWVAFVYLTNQINPDLSWQFIESIAIGASLGATDPRLALRNWLSNARRLPNAGHHLGVYIKAWNDWLNGARRTLIGGFKPGEAFPRLVEVDRRVPEPTKEDDDD